MSGRTDFVFLCLPSSTREENSESISRCVSGYYSYCRWTLGPVPGTWENRPKKFMEFISQESTVLRSHWRNWSFLGRRGKSLGAHSSFWPEPAGGGFPKWNTWVWGKNFPWKVLGPKNFKISDNSVLLCGPELKMFAHKVESSQMGLTLRAAQKF